MRLCADYEQMILEPKSVYGIDLVDNFQGDGSQVRRLDREDALVSGDAERYICLLPYSISLDSACLLLTKPCEMLRMLTQLLTGSGSGGYSWPRSFYLYCAVSHRLVRYSSVVGRTILHVDTRAKPADQRNRIALGQL